MAVAVTAAPAKRTPKGRANSKSRTKPATFQTRFSDADEMGFIQAAEGEVSDTILDYLKQQALQRGINRTILISSTKNQITAAGDDSFSFDVFEDWRGRYGYSAAGLAPQGKDFGRGALQAATPRRLGLKGLRFLMIGVATTWGHDIGKATMTRRVRGVCKMLRDGSLAAMIADAKAGTGFLWRTASDPAQFVAAAADLLAALATGRAIDYKSAIFIGMDATCSGLQILAAVTGCPDTARLVNVLPKADGSRADIYEAGGAECIRLCKAIVAGMSADELAQAHVYLAIAEAAAAETARFYRDSEAAKAGGPPALPRDAAIMDAAKAIPAGDHWAVFWAGRGVSRDDMKKPIMVYCYGGKIRTFAGAISEATRAPWAGCNYLAAMLYNDVLAVMLPKAHAFMIAMQAVARHLSQHGKAVEFTAANGFPFRQAVMEQVHTQVRCHLADGRSLQIAMQKGTNVLDTAKQVTGVAPNIVHHWDALFLGNVVRAFAAAGIADFFTVHDCFYLMAADWVKGMKIVRETFASTFHANVARDLWKAIAANAPDDKADIKAKRDDAAAAWEDDGGPCLPPRLMSLPPCPARGDLDITAVLRSEFLFS